MSNRNHIKRNDNIKAKIPWELIFTAAAFLLVIALIILVPKTKHNKIDIPKEIQGNGKDTISQISICINGPDEKVHEIIDAFCQTLIDNEIHISLISSPICEHDIYGGHFDTYKITIEDTSVSKLDLLRKDFTKEHSNYVKYIYFDDEEY